MDVEARVLGLMSRLFQLDVLDIPLSATFEELGADSADFVELQIMLLEEFGVELPARDDVDSLSVQQVVDYVRSESGV